MKYIRKTSKDITSDFLNQLLLDRHIIEDDDDFRRDFFSPSSNNLHDPSLLDHVEEGYQMLIKHINNGSKIYLVIDSDVDGYTSSAVVYKYLNAMYPTEEFHYTIDYHVPEGKEHGLQTLMKDLSEEKKYDLIILPDSSSNDYEEHKILHDMGYDILVIDHHEADHYSENAVVINNQLSKNYPNKALSGVGVVYKFFKYCETHNNHDHANFYIDLVALGEISDMMNMETLENRYLCEYGLSHIHNKFFYDLIEKQSFSLGNELTQIGIAFYITPLINALIRMGSYSEKERLFEAFIDPNKEVDSTKRGEKGMKETVSTQVTRNCVNAKARQNKERDKAIELLDIQIMNNCLDENKIIILNADDLNIPYTLTGLCAMGVSAKYKKPVMLGRLSKDGFLRGSMRGRGESALKDFRKFLLNSSMIEFVEGHPNAAGFGIKNSDIDKLINYANKELAEVNFNEGFYEADFIVKGNCSYIGELIDDLDNGKNLWGQSNDEPVLVVENITLPANGYAVIGKNNDTLRFEYNGVTYVKFKATDLIQDLSLHSGKLSITAAGKANMNEWGGRRTPQILVEEIEINEINDYDF